MTNEPDGRGRGFWLVFAIGVMAMAWGTWLFVGATARTGERIGLGLWIVLSDIIVDWLAVPMITLAGWLVSRWVPPFARAPAQVGLILSGTVMAVAWLPLQNTAAPTGNPTIQPINYTVATTVTLGLIWLVMTLWSARRWSAAHA